MMNKSEVLRTPMVDVYEEDGILFMTIHNQNIGIDDAKGHVKMVAERFKHLAPWGTLIEGTMRANVTKEARDYLSGDEVTNVTTCGALLVDSTVARIGGNLFLQFFKPKFPTKMFTDRAKAIEWIREQLKK